MGLILLCAATGVEARACRAGVERAGLGTRFEVLRTGMGPEAAHAALTCRLALAAPRPAAIISTGFAGSLSPKLPVGVWATGRSIRAKSGPPHELRPHPGAVPVDFLSVTEPVDATIPGHGESVDMESYAWALIARDAGIPFSILRLISDSPEQPLPAAIRTFSMLGKTRSLKQLARGLAEAASEPARLTGFLARCTRLPGELTRGWERFAGEVPGYLAMPGAL